MTVWNAQHKATLTEELHCAIACKFYYFTFLFLLLPEIKSKSCLYGKRMVSLSIGQTTVITLISYAASSLSFENVKLFSIYSSQCGLQNFCLLESHSDLVYPPMQPLVR